METLKGIWIKVDDRTVFNAAHIISINKVEINGDFCINIVNVRETYTCGYIDEAARDKVFEELNKSLNSIMI